MKNKCKEKTITNLLLKILICNLIFLILIFLSKNKIEYKDKIFNLLYEDSIKFAEFKKIYNKYLGGVLSIGDRYNTESYVFDEKINYHAIIDYYDGAKLSVSEHYLVPNIREGIVVYIGKKDKYGSVVIVEDNIGIYNWYGNICNSTLKIYDHIDKSNYIGESCQNYIYLVFSKDSTFLDYNKFIN